MVVVFIVMLCFILSLLLGLLLVSESVSWITDLLRFRVSFFCVAIAYVPIATYAIRQLCVREVGWTTLRRRIAGGFLIGISMALFGSGAIAIYSENGLKQFHSGIFGNFLKDKTARSSVDVEQMKSLLFQAELLGVLGTFFEDCLPSAVLIGLCTPVLIELCGSELERRTKTRGNAGATSTK